MPCEYRAVGCLWPLTMGWDVSGAVLGYLKRVVFEFNLVF